MVELLNQDWLCYRPESTMDVAANGVAVCLSGDGALGAVLYRLGGIKKINPFAQVESVL